MNRNWSECSKRNHKCDDWVFTLLREMCLTHTQKKRNHDENSLIPALMVRKVQCFPCYENYTLKRVCPKGYIPWLPFFVISFIDLQQVDNGFTSKILSRHDYLLIKRSISHVKQTNNNKNQQSHSQPSVLKEQATLTLSTVLFASHLLLNSL